MIPAKLNLRLRQPSSALWLSTAVAAPNQLLDDHSQCELKAATNALALVGRHCDKDALVAAMSNLALEETRHFRQVRRHLLRRGGKLSRPARSPYLAGLSAGRRGGEHGLLEELMIAAVVEARSCERFELLEAAFRAQGEIALAQLYEQLIRSERGHATLFLDLALRYYRAADVQAELDRRLELEVLSLESLPVSTRMHGGHRPLACQADELSADCDAEHATS